MTDHESLPAQHSMLAVSHRLCWPSVSGTGAQDHGLEDMEHVRALTLC